jgi:hypothetical protein
VLLVLAGTAKVVVPGAAVESVLPTVPVVVVAEVPVGSVVVVGLPVVPPVIPVKIAGVEVEAGTDVAVPLTIGGV